MTRGGRSGDGRPRCTECRQIVDIADPTVVTREVPAGLNMNRIHRMIRVYWHAGCWADVEAFNAESRRQAQEQHQADMLELIAAAEQSAGITPERAAELRARLSPSTGG